MVGLRIAAALVCAVLVSPAAGLAEGTGQQSTSTADHTAFDSLKGPFTSGPAVTAACIACHTEADDQVMHSIHFTWDYQNP